MSSPETVYSQAPLIQEASRAASERRWANRQASLAKIAEGLEEKGLPLVMSKEDSYRLNREVSAQQGARVESDQ